MTGTGAGPHGPERRVPASPYTPPVAVLCREYAMLAAAAAAGLADFLDDVAALAVRVLPTAQSARIRVREPEVVTAIADAPGRLRADREGVLAIPLVGRGDLSGVLELAPEGDGFPVHERELAEVLAVLLALSLATDRAA